MGGKATAILAMVLLLSATIPARAQAEYFTAVEIDRIRDTQEVERRIPVFLAIAEERLAHLGLIELEEGGAPSGGALGRIGGAIIKIISPDAGEHIEEQTRQAEENYDAQQAAMAEFTPTDLLRGYYQALDEAMNNIEDAYERGRGEVREPIEALKEFAEETIPLLERFEPESEYEQEALDDAIEQAEYALERAEYALTVVPKTERK